MMKFSFYLLKLFLASNLIFSTSVASSTIPNNDLKSMLIEIGALDKKIIDIEKVWNMAFEWNDESRLVNNSLSEKRKQILHFLTLSKKNQNKLLKKNRKLASTAKIWLPTYKKIQFEKSKIEKEISKLVKDEISVVDRLLKDFHNRKFDFPGSSLDYLFGVDYNQVEIQISDKYWDMPDNVVGLPKQWSQSDYRILRDLFTNFPIDKNSKIYDLGSGYGRFLYYGGILEPNSKFTGIELVCERVDQVNKNLRRLRITNTKAICGDVLLEDFSDGDIFFIFNSFPSIMDKVLKRIETIAKKKKIIIIGLGQTYSDLKKIPWMKFEKDLSDISNLGFFSADLVGQSESNR